MTQGFALRPTGRCYATFKFASQICRTLFRVLIPLFLILLSMLLIYSNNLLNLAEKEGFEPSVRYERTHAFQACALNRSAISPFHF